MREYHYGGLVRRPRSDRSGASASAQHALFAAADFRQLLAIPTLMDRLLQSLGHLRDPRCETVLLAVAGHRVGSIPGRQHREACISLIRLGSRRSMTRVVEVLQDIEGLNARLDPAEPTIYLYQAMAHNIGPPSAQH